MKLKKPYFAMITLFLQIVFSCTAFGNEAIKVNKLSCEYIENPLGIETSFPRLSWTISGTGRNQSQSAYEILVSDNIKDASQLKGNVWNTGKVISAENIHIQYNGKVLKSFTRYYWRVKIYDQDGVATGWSELNWFETAMLHPSDWQAQWISDGSTQFASDEEFYQTDPMPLFRKSFKTNKKLSSARLYVSGIGYYEAYLNGEKIGDHVLDPGWTAYAKEILYAVFDITEQVHQGNNTAGIMLGNGFYNPLPLRFWGGLNMRAELTTGRPNVKAMIRLNYADGSTVVIPTDETWHTAPGPVMRNSVYLGEHYDARFEKEDWSSPKPVDPGWKAATVVDGPAGILRIQMQPPIRITKILKPVEIAEIKPGVFVVDMGQNFAGVARLRVKGPAGTKVTLRYGEDKYPDGHVNLMTSVTGQIKNNNGGPGAPPIAWQEDSYTLKGKGVETWSPRFTFHGFRYLEITGWPGKPTLNDMDGLRMNADLETDGEFSSSNTMFNKLNETIQWTFLSNVFSLQSDCPAREKLGYGGDLLCTTEAFMYNYNMANFYGKVLRDFTNDQRPEGGITETMPFVGIADAGPGDKSGPLGFQAGYPYLVKKMYDFYGDKRIVADHYEALTRHINFLQAKAKDHLFDKEDLGDHESLDAKAIPFTPSVFYYLQVSMMADFAAILGKKEDEAIYENLSNAIREAIVGKFSPEGNGEFEMGTQTAQLFALWSEIDQGEKEGLAFKKLVSTFEQKNWHLSTGIFGTKMLFDVLRKADENEMAYRIANQRAYPGWGYMLANGATTLWETWASSDNTYSKNHPMFGSVGEWFYRSLLGINAAEPGFKKVIIKPQPAGDLKHAKGSFNSVYGKIQSAWEITDQQFKLDVKIPVNTTAEVWIPTKFGNDIREGTKKVSDAEGVKYLRSEKGYAVFHTGSGSFSFVSNLF